ncbi:hypothetical protein O59_003351 [Cellvibrio sp. BR]|nr:hypothetical protein O59_003351 [Cellvibrio sp. BR]
MSVAEGSGFHGQRLYSPVISVKKPPRNLRAATGYICP